MNTAKKTMELLLVFLTLFALEGSAYSQEKEKPIPSLNSRQAYARWQAAPEKINILDVRTQAEYIFVGHAPMAINIPLMFLKSEFNAETKRYAMPMNPDFIEEVKARFHENDTLFVICRSGGRSAKSIKMLMAAGFKNVFNISDGFEGGKLNLPGSYKNGQRIINGWKNSGAPWTNKIDPALVYKKSKK